jgi:autophagy-related protein 101
MVTFSERRQKKSWFYVGEEDVPWEKWCVFWYFNPRLPHALISPLHLAGSSTPKCDNRNLTEARILYKLHNGFRKNLHSTLLDRQAFSATLTAALTESLHKMLIYTSSEQGRTAVPVITSASGISPFPIKVTVHIDGVEVG